MSTVISTVQEDSAAQVGWALSGTWSHDHHVTGSVKHALLWLDL